MLTWISSNSQVLTVVVNFAMLLVWIFYAQLLLNNYRRQRRPRLLINQAGGRGMHSRCLICNMSQEAIFVDFVLAALHTSSGERLLPVTDFQFEQERDGAKQLEHGTHEGPLQPGSCLDVGMFESVYKRVSQVPLEGSKEPTPISGDEEIHRLEIQAVAIYGSEDLPIGARRRFAISGHDGEQRELRPETVDTQYYLSRRERRRMRDLMKRYL